MPLIFFYGMVALATALLERAPAVCRRCARAGPQQRRHHCHLPRAPRLFDEPLTLDSVRDDTALVLLLGLGTTAGVAAVALALVPAIMRSGARLRFLPRFRHAAVATMVRLSGWTVGYVIANQIALWVVLVLANSNDMDGGPFLYLSAYAFFQLPHGLLAVSLMTTIAPEMASAAARNDIAGLRERLSFGLRMTIMVVLPAAAAFIGIARPMVVALAPAGRVHRGRVGVTAEAIIGFAVGLVPFSVYLFSLRAFYSFQDTRTPFLLNCFENAANIVLAFPLYAWLGIPGLALAFSGAYALAAVATLAVLRRRLGTSTAGASPTPPRACWWSGRRCGTATWAISRGLGWETTGRAVLTTIVGVIVGAGVCLAGLVVVRVPELAELRALLPGRTGGPRENEGLPSQA